MNTSLLSEELCFKNICVHTHNWNHGAHWTFILLGEQRNQRELSRYLVSNYFPTQMFLDSFPNLWGFMELGIMVQATLITNVLEIAAEQPKYPFKTHFHRNNTAPPKISRNYCLVCFLNRCGIYFYPLKNRKGARLAHRSNIFWND